MTQIAVHEQMDFFEPSMSSLDARIRLLETCPWLRGRYKNKLWRHSLHALSSYPSKLRPQIAGFFIEFLSEPGDVVLDPMAGSGTVPLQACLTGRTGIGIDLSPYAHLLQRVKVNPPSLGTVLDRIEQLAAKLTRFPSVRAPDEVKDFFHERTLREILAFRALLNDEDDCDATILALLCGILHGGRPGFLSRRTRDIIPLRPSGPFEYRPVVPRLRAKALRAYCDSFPKSFRPGRALLADCRSQQAVRVRSADLIICSPPFFEHTEFVRHNWLRLWLVGWDLEQQKLKATEFFGEKASNLPRFRKDLETLVLNSHRWLRQGGFCVFHGGRKRTGESMSDMLVAAAKSLSLEVVSVIDEKEDHSMKHAMRKSSGESHDFVILRKRE